MALPRPCCPSPVKDPLVVSLPSDDGRFPRLGDTFEFGSWRFEVIDIDRRRIDKVLAQPLRKPMIAP